METNFIEVSELVNVKYYGIRFRLDVVRVSGSDFGVWILSKRTCNHRDEFTKKFDEPSDAFNELRAHLGRDVHDILFHAV